MDEAAAIATEYARKQSDERIAEKIDIIKQSGTQIISLDEQTREQIRKAVQPVYDQIEREVDHDLYKAYTEK